MFLAVSRQPLGSAMEQAVSRQPLIAWIEFDPRSVHVRFVVDAVELGQVFYPSTSVFPCQ